jgi:hypothetical protein
VIDIEHASIRLLLEEILMRVENLSDIAFCFRKDVESILRSVPDELLDIQPGKGL